MSGRESGDNMIKGVWSVKIFKNSPSYVSRTILSREKVSEVAVDGMVDDYFFPCPGNDR